MRTQEEYFPKNMKCGSRISVLAILALILFMARPGYTITCGLVDTALMPCISYLTGHGGYKPSSACCGGVKSVEAMGRTTADKRDTCNCVKAAANRYPGMKDALAQSLPVQCGIHLDIPVSRTVECNEEITCGEVDVALLSCIDYLRGREAEPTPACCNGVKDVKGMGQTPADKRTCCNCVKAAANRYPDLKDLAAQSLPANCGVQLDIPISRSVTVTGYKMKFEVHDEENMRFDSEIN